MTIAFSKLNIIVLIIIFVLSLIVLTKAADVLVKSAVGLSRSLGLSELMIGATIVSIGTTLPEFSSSLIATVKGVGGFALGNAIGSTITNICLVLGLSAMLGKIPVNKRSSKSLIMLVVITIILIGTSISGKAIPRYTGIVFLLMIPVYVFVMLKTGKSENQEKIEVKEGNTKKKNIFRVLFIIISAIFVALGASFLTSTVEEIAFRLHVPEAIVSATIVAFGTSIPELSTTLASIKKGYGELALGNIMGANTLNILLVIGSAATISKNSIQIPINFYYVHFPLSIICLVLFGFFVYNGRWKEIRRREGLVLVLFYVIYLGANILTTGL